MPAEAVVVMIVVVAAAGIFIWSLTLRYRTRELQHRERLAAIEKGVALPGLSDGESHMTRGPRAYLLRGLVWLLAGIPLSIFLFGISITTQHPKTVQQKAFEIQRLKGVGASEELIRQVENDNRPIQELPLGFGLLGLVPAGIGIAYLIVYRLERKDNQVR
jgi:hypothetical protein